MRGPEYPPNSDNLVAAATRDTVLEWLKSAKLETHAPAAAKIASFYTEAQNIPHVDRILVGWDPISSLFDLMLVISRDPSTPDEMITGKDTDDRRLFALHLKFLRERPTPIYSELAPKAAVDRLGNAEFFSKKNPHGHYLGTLPCKR